MRKFTARIYMSTHKRKRPSPDLSDGEGDTLTMKRSKMTQTLGRVTPDPSLETSLESRAEQVSESESSEESEEDSEEESDVEAEGIEYAGVIQKISLKNFMCHDYFEVELGPRLNFIIGRNGSGKSAVITGLAVGLGAKATVTSRGSNLQSLIKDDKSVAEISITFKNRGLDAYEPDKYGDEITIQRRLTRKSGGGYLIKDANGLTKSNKKYVVDEILATYNVRVDNPMTFLSQDKAREFLTTTDDKQKFKYFMEGTLITDIVKNYQSADNDLSDIDSKLYHLKQEQAVIQEKFNEWSKIYQKYKQSDNLRHKLELINGKIFWYNVTKIEQAIAKNSGNIDRIKEELSTREQEKANKINKKEEYVTKRAELEELIVSLKEGITEKQMAVSNKRNDHKKITSKFDEKVEEIKSNEKEVKNLQKAIAKMEENLEVEREKISKNDPNSIAHQMEELKEDLLKAQIKKADISEQKDNIESHEYNVKLGELKKERSDTENNIRSLKEQIKSLEESRKNKFGAWGRQIERLVEKINQTNDWHEKPLGPLGSYISIKEKYRTWTELLGSVLSRPLDAFIVSDEHDRRMLNDLMGKYQIKNVNIMIRKFETFDYTYGMPKNQTTVLDMLKFSNETIRYTLIDFNNIEKCIISDAEQADKLIREENVMSVFSKVSKSSGRRTTGSANNISMDPIYYGGRALLKFAVSSEEDLNVSLRETKSRLQEEINTLNSIDLKIAATKTNLSKLGHDLQRLLDKSIKKIREVKRKMSELEDISNSSNASAVIESLEADIEENKNVIETTKSIIVGFGKDLEELKGHLDEESAALEETKGQLEALETEIQEKSKLLVHVKDEVINLETELSKFDVGKIKKEKQIEHYKEKLVKYEDQLKTNTDNAEKICTREEVSITDEDTRDSIQSEYYAVQKAVEDAELTLSYDFEEIQSNLLLFKDKSDEAEEKVLGLERANRELRTDFNERMEYLKLHLESNINQVQRSFPEALSRRRYKGKLIIDTVNQKISIYVAPQSATDDRAVESLSGGEKSFTQLAFLLSIWNITDSRIRGLDEFDVFMDSVNRTVSIRLLMDELRRRRECQTILVTPQDITNVGDLTGDDVRIHKMSNPRGD